MSSANHASAQQAGVALQIRKNRLIIFIMRKATIGFILVFLAFLPAFGQEDRPLSEREELKHDVLVEDQDFIYWLNIFPSTETEGLFHWEVVMKNIKSGEIIARFRANTMRGQENIFERMLRPDGEKITITASIDSNKSRIVYRIQRSQGKEIIFSNEGEKEIFY